MESVKKYKILLFIFFGLVFCFIIYSYFCYKLNIVQAVSSEIKMEFDIIGNEEKSLNKEFSVIVPDNEYEEWNRYIWKNEIDFSDNIINISGYGRDNINLVRIYISKCEENSKLKDILKPYDNASKQGVYSKKDKIKIGDTKIYFYERYTNIDTRKSYQYVFEKYNNIFMIEGNYRLGEDEYFNKIIRQIVLSIK